MDNEFDVEKWQKEYQMDYIKAFEFVKQTPYKNEIFEVIYKITRLQIPDILYKYVSLTDDIELNERKFDTLLNKKVYMSDPKKMNDPFDNKAYFYRTDNLAKYPRLSIHNGKLIDDFSAFVKFSAFSASSVNSMPMWAHYANNHNGFCLSFDMKERRNISLSSNMFPIQYTNRRIDITELMEEQAKKLIGEVDKQILEGKKQVLIDDLSLVYMASLFCNIKHETWSYEKEFRCISGTKAKGMPYISAIPKEIFIGMNCVKTYEDKLIKIASALQIPINKMIFDELSNEFNLSIHQIG